MKNNDQSLLRAFLLVALFAGASARPIHAQTAISFSNGISDYSNNFRAIKNSGNPSLTVTSYGGSSALTVSGGTNASASGVAFVYDTTPGDGTSTQNLFSSPVTVSLDFQGTTAGSSLGIFFGNAAESSSVLALFNLDFSGTSDEIRFFSGNPSGTNLGADTLQSAGTFTGSSGGNAGGGYIQLQVTYSVSGTTPTLTVSAGTLSATYTFAAGTAIDPSEIGFRFYDVNNTSSSGYLTNVSISTVPEPSSLALSMAAAASICIWGGMALRRRKTASP